jgi:hypothetical protein
VFRVTIMIDGFVLSNLAGRPNVSLWMLAPAMHRVSDSTCCSDCDDWPTASCRTLPSDVGADVEGRA